MENKISFVFIVIFKCKINLYLSFSFSFLFVVVEELSLHILSKEQVATLNCSLNLHTETYLCRVIDTGRQRKLHKGGSPV